MNRVACTLVPAILLLCCACDRAPEKKPTFAVRAVCKPKIAQLEAAIEAPPPVAKPADLEERVRGLVLDRAESQGRMRALMLEDLVAIGEAAVPVLATILLETDRRDAEILSVLEVLGAIDAPTSADVLAARIDPEKVRVPWIRAQAAFQLSKQSSDRVLAWVLSQLKYESHGESVVWIAAVLARHKNYAGVSALRLLARNAAQPEVAAEAQSMLEKIVADAGFTDADALSAAWNSPDPERKVPREEPSPGLRLEIWRRIANLAEFDLRIVDDARYVLANSAAWVVPELVEALHDEVPHVRVHVTQCLERMGPRGSGACAELVRALDEPQMAGAAAEALASVACTNAIEPLVQRTRAGNDAEMRNAAAMALGRLSSPASTAALRALFAPSEPLDLRQIAAQALLLQGEDQEAARLLVDCLTLPGADAGAAENALGAWLARRAESGAEKDVQLLAAWTEAGGDPREIANAAMALERRKKRLALVEPLVKGAAAPAAPR